MALRDIPPILELSDFRWPRVLLAFALLGVRTGAWALAWWLLFFYGPAKLGYYIGQQW